MVVREAPTDVVVVGGRIVDPAHGVDGFHDLYVARGAIQKLVAEGSRVPAGATVLSAEGAVVTPGFVDVHSHMASDSDLLLQVQDGVTTALEMEAGTLGRAADDVAILNRGSSASWALARMQVEHGAPRTGGFEAFAAGSRSPAWSRRLGSSDVRRVLGVLEDELAAGALGVGMLLGYAPETSTEEVREVARACASHDRLLTVHSRFMARDASGKRDSLAGVEEVVRVSAESGARVHLCHINSTMLGGVGPAMEVIEHGRAAGARVTTEAYPYSCGCTVVGAPFLSPRNLQSVGIDVGAVELVAGDGPFRDFAEIELARRSVPDRLALFHWSNAADWAQRLTPYDTPGVIVASDAMPTVAWAGGSTFTHPRGAASFATAVRGLLDHKGWSVADVVDRCSNLPARIVGGALSRKGHLGVGADADVLVFAPSEVRPRASFRRTAPSTGFRHVLVGGEPVVLDGVLRPDCRPGRPLVS